MKTTLLCYAVFIVFTACAGTPEQEFQKITNSVISVKNSKPDTIINFENEICGKPPVGFSQTCTGEKQKFDWRLQADSKNLVLAQTANNHGDYYNLLVWDKQKYGNFSMSIRINAISGKEDQGGGIVWRYVDNNNYYLARYNPLEKNFCFYCVVNGIRKQLFSIDENIKTDEWFSMSVTMIKNKIICSLNGKVIFDISDDTFTKSGKVGFWTKSDAFTYFDDFEITKL